MGVFGGVEGGDGKEMWYVGGREGERRKDVDLGNCGGLNGGVNKY